MSVIDTKAPLTLSDLFAALPGAFLLAGYLLAWAVATKQPLLPVTVTQQTANYDVRQISVPDAHAERERSLGSSSYPVNFPALDNTGKPTLNLQEQTFSGRGKPRIIEEATEILLPTIGDPPVIATKSLAYVPPMPQTHSVGTYYTKITYTPNVTFKGTGVYEIKKSVVFDAGVNPDKYAVIGGVIGAVVSLLYFLVKILKSFFTAEPTDEPQTTE